ncbi:HTH-type transcriptional regulator TfdS [Nonomuraea coxensis DSM 45129]|uniref:HTH-type transcriptional regulator TfdS n=1 Tax=Nonomuraea coxensis DSM 45129 TaxID=1122611 RepID=A0ABX8UED9_9ACTN|nr:LysR family transcriptional regulator [Nonomuraea coxensis]QYC45159.1 HTH-type transcriptional regulator TfdS [Nonomuraea coxensis DSM 45129]
MELRLLGYVVAIAEEGSISGAARRLQLTQPTLSRQLGELERRLGVELFARAGRGLVPTAAGQALLRRAVRMLADAEAALDDVRLAAAGKIGRLTVGFAGSGINGVLGDALGRLRVDLPDVDLRLVELFDDAEMSGGILDGTLDVAVQRLPARDARLATRVWAREPLALFLPAGHPLARSREPAPVSVLGEIPLVLWPRESAPHAHDEITSLCHHAGIVPRIGARGRTVQTILALVAAGFGGAVMASSYRVLHREGVVPRRLTGTATTLHLVWRAGDASPLLARFIAAVNSVKARHRDERPSTPEGASA